MDVSILVLCYNQESTIERTLLSILNQKTSYSYEIIVGDDDSNDNTRMVCEKIVKENPTKVKLNEIHSNYGIVKNYVSCVERCSGRYLMCCAGDDWWHNQNKIQKQVDFMDAHEDCSMCYGGYNEYYPTLNKTFTKTPISIIGDQFEFILKCNPICAPTSCIRYSSLQQINIATFLEQGFLVEDWPLWLGLSLVGKIGCLAESFVTYSIYSGSAHNPKDYDKRLVYIDNFHKMREYFINKSQRHNGLLESEFDFYYEQKGDTAVKYNRRKDALSSYKKIKKRTRKNSIKMLLCCFDYTFRMLCKKYNKGL